MNFNLSTMALTKQQELESGSMKYYYVKLRDKDILDGGYYLLHIKESDYMKDKEK